MLTTASNQPSKPGRRRVAVFASYSGDGYLPPQVLPYLAGLKPLTSAIVVVCDNDLAPGEREKLAPFATHVITGRHGEYDFGSYKRGTSWARENGLLADADDLILCNDSCYGPVGSFAPMFEKMEARQLDFWGATDSHQFTYHLQSYWVVLSRKVFSSNAFKTFIAGIKKQNNVQQVILNYELGMTNTLVAAGFSVGAMLENTLKGTHPKDPSFYNLPVFPLYTLTHGVPLVKVKALRFPHTNADGQNRLLAWLRENAPATYASAISDVNIRRFADADKIGFSLIMPTRNRAWCISKAIRSVMDQTHRNFELIIVDDGSTDETEKLIRSEFADELDTGMIRYVQLTQNLGVCSARNVGHAYARNPWIGYADSDNVLRPYFLTMVANAIVSNPGTDAFYGQIIHVGSGTVIGKSFDRKQLRENNFIDLGAFVHRKSQIARFGGFDTDLRRLVDWDLIIRTTEHKDPVFIPRVFLEYADEEKSDRITVSESFIGARVAIHAKHAVKPTVSTAIICYNHQEFLVEAIESAISQKGDFTHEILISDDGSTDGSLRIIERYARNYPNLIRNISRGGNFGISENYKHCFREAAGEFVAILEGDDYWIDDSKNFRQARFLEEHKSAAMVFSKVKLFDMRSQKSRTLKRQMNLRTLLDGTDFARDGNLNPIVNFSSAMFVRKIMSEAAPSFLYEPRVSEITLAFYFDRIDRKIGFLDELMGVYRLNPSSVWTGASIVSKLKQAIAAREVALEVARREHRPAIQKALDEKRMQLAALQAADARKSA